MRRSRGSFRGRGSGRLVSGAHEVLAELGETRLFAVHLQPDAAERVVDEKLDDVARREELVAHGQLAAVARRLALVAHLLALFAAIEELVDPADRLVLAPDPRQLGGVQDGQQRLERRRFGQSTEAASRRSKRTLTSVESSSNRLSM